MTLRTSIATVCLSGTLVEKLHACAAAEFDGVEIFEPDLIGSPASPEEIAALAARLGLTLDLYQPFRDAEGVTEERFADVVRRARSKFRLMQRLGIDTMLVCSNVGTATIDDDDVSADQLRRLGDEAAAHGVRLAFEALAWGKYVDDYRRAWRIVQLADHPAVGVCLDSFHILSRDHDPAAIEQIPGDKIFFLQLADAPALTMDVLSWSRHHRLFPGQGAFDLAEFVRLVLATGYSGPLSLEVFNDVFRQSDPNHTAVDAMRSLLVLKEKLGLGDLPAAPALSGYAFTEVASSDDDMTDTLAALGFRRAGRHTTEPVALWRQGDATLAVRADAATRITTVGVASSGPEVSLRRAEHLLATPVEHGVTAPDGTTVVSKPIIRVSNSKTATTLVF